MRTSLTRRLVTPEAGTIRVPNGITDGAGAVRFLGISGKTQCYETDLSEEELTGRAVECMRSIGRGVYLRQHPEAAACLIRYVITRPALLVFRWVEGRGILTAWTGRGLMSWASRRRAIHAFERTMGDAIRFSTAPPPEEEPEKKRRRKGKKNRPKEAAPPEEAREASEAAPEYTDDEYADEYGGESGEAPEYTDDEYEGEYGEYADEYDRGYDEEYDSADEYGRAAQEEDGKA